MSETSVVIDSRVRQITEEHVRDADRLMAEIWRELPHAKDSNSYTEEPTAMENGGISYRGEMFHAPFIFPHARVGQDLYLLKTFTDTMEQVWEVISEMPDQENLAWGVDVDANLAFDLNNAAAAVDYKSIGYWRKEVNLPDFVKAKLGVINE